MGRRAAAVSAGVLATVLALGGCGEDDDVPVTAADTAFSLATDEASPDLQRVSGHGVSLEVPADWVPSGDERLGGDQRSYEWAVQAPEGDPFPVFVNMSMGVAPDAGTPFEAVATGVKEVGGISPDFEVLDEGEVDVPGAARAYELHLERADSADGTSVRVEQWQVVLELPSGVVSTLRFQVPQGGGDTLDAVRDSLVVAEET